VSALNAGGSGAAAAHPVNFNAVQLDALRELANIGAGTASTALSQMLGRSIDLSVPDARVLPMEEAVSQLGSAEDEITGIVLGVEGELPATVLMLLTPQDAESICAMLGLAADDELAPSALGEIGNVVGTSYLNALAGMTGIEIEPTPPATVTDFLGAIVESVLAARALSSDHTLLMDSSLVIENEDCSIAFLLVPEHGGAEELLTRIGVS
jgi:chemotaxis protein CheC